MKRSFIAACCAVLLASCAKSEDPAQGSQTHFLDSCEDSCAPPYDCLCGVCTLPCEQDDACASEADDARCVSASGSCGAGLLCDVECTNDDDCEATNDAFVCESGRCRAPEVIEIGMAGSGGASGSSGQGGAGGEGGSGGDWLGGICDGSDDIVLGYSVGGGQVESTYYITNPYGHSFLFLDGQCNYYVSLDYNQGLFTGRLLLDDEIQLATDIAWDSMAEMAAEPELDSCPDAGESVIWAQGYRMSCTCGCDPGPLADQKDAALQAMHARIETLIAQGYPANGPLRAVAGELGPETGEEKAWPLDRALADVPNLVQDVQGGSFGDPAFFTGPADVVALRALRPAMSTFGGIQVRDAGTAYQLFMRDELPARVDQKIDALLTMPAP